MSKFETNPNNQIRNLEGRTNLPFRISTFLITALCVCQLPTPGVAASDYGAVDAIFAKHCLDCHASKDPEGQLGLASCESLM
jgi:hypothetical protein